MRFSSPITTKRNIKHNLLAAEEAVEIACRTTIERHNRRAPTPNRRVPTQNISRYLASWEEPDSDARAGPLRCVDASPITVEVVAVGIGCGRGDTTACVGGILVTVRVGECGAAL